MVCNKCFKKFAPMFGKPHSFKSKFENLKLWVLY